MNRIHVCSLALVKSHLQSTGATHLMTLLGPAAKIEWHADIPPKCYLRVGISDIVAGEDGRMSPEHERDGHILPEELHVREVLNFARRWMRTEGKGPLLIHCYAGVSRSTAAAYMSVLALDPARDEHDLAVELRRLSPTASPNPRLIEIADRVLGRDGRMIEAIRSIGRGEDCYEGVPFSLDITVRSKEIAANVGKPNGLDALKGDNEDQRSR